MIFYRCNSIVVRTKMCYCSALEREQDLDTFPIRCVMCETFYLVVTKVIWYSRSFIFICKFATTLFPRFLQRCVIRGWDVLLLSPCPHRPSSTMQSLSASHCRKTNILPLAVWSSLCAKGLPWGRSRRGESALPWTRTAKHNLRVSCVRA